MPMKFEIRNQKSEGPEADAFGWDEEFSRLKRIKNFGFRISSFEFSLSQ
jgi:hypothetical protein